MPESLPLSLNLKPDGTLDEIKWHDQAPQTPDELRRRGDMLLKAGQWMHATAAIFEPTGPNLVAIVGAYSDSRISTHVLNAVQTEAQRDWLRRTLTFAVDLAVPPDAPVSVETPTE